MLEYIQNWWYSLMNTTFNLTSAPWWPTVLKAAHTSSTMNQGIWFLMLTIIAQWRWGTKQLNIISFVYPAYLYDSLQLTGSYFFSVHIAGSISLHFRVAIPSNYDDKLFCSFGFLFAVRCSSFVNMRVLSSILVFLVHVIAGMKLF